MRFFAQIVASLLILSPFAQAENLTLFQKESPAPAFPGYTDSSNLSPAFHILQNDLELKDYAIQNIYTNGVLTQVVTDLCIPSSMADLLLYQYAIRATPLSALKIPGVTPGAAQVDGAEIVHGLIEQCDFNPHTKQNLKGLINWVNAADCLAGIYSQSGYGNTSIQYIRKNQPPGKSSHVSVLNRDPTLQDIVSALRAGKEVIADIAYTKQKIDGTYEIAGTHAINLFGYGMNTEDNSKILIDLQNSNRLYNMDFSTPIYDVAGLSVTSTPVAEKTSAIELTTLQGRLLNFAGEQTFIAGLVIIQPQ